MRITELESFLVKPICTPNDVSAYLEVGKSKAYEVIEICRTKFGGKVFKSDKCCSLQSLLNYMGTTIEDEMKKIAAYHQYDGVVEIKTEDEKLALSALYNPSINPILNLMAKAGELSSEQFSAIKYLQRRTAAGDATSGRADSDCSPTIAMKTPQAKRA